MAKKTIGELLEPDSDAEPHEKRMQFGEALKPSQETEDERDMRLWGPSKLAPGPEEPLERDELKRRLELYEKLPPPPKKFDHPQRKKVG